MGDRYGEWDINEISIGISIWDVGHRYGIWYIDMVIYHIYHIDMVILDIDMGYGLMICEMTVSIRSSPISIWDILSLCTRVRNAPPARLVLDTLARWANAGGVPGRGSHSSTFRLNISRFDYTSPCPPV